LLHRTTSSPQSGADHADFTRSARGISQAREQFAGLPALHATKRWKPGSRGPTATVVEQSS
jgi:hypothetical protein